MKLNFLIKYYGPETALAVGATEAGLQNFLGLFQLLTGGAKTKKLLDQRKAYKTPEEIFKILQATQSIQGGLGAQTLQYLTGEVDQGLASSINAATLLGGDPNQLSATFGQKIREDMRIGNQNHLEGLKNFDKYISALGLVADNLAAEQKSEQDILKDKLQSASADKISGTRNIAESFGTLNSVLSSKEIMDLYKDTIGTTNGIDLNAGYVGGIDEADVISRSVKNRKILRYPR